MRVQGVESVTGRRAVLLGGLAGLGAVLVGCSSDPPPVGGTSAPAPVPPSTPPSASAGVLAAQAELAALEAKFGGRVGMYAVDTGSGASVRHRADERFLMCSTHKALVVAAVLRLRLQQPGLMEKVIRYDRSKLLKHAPVTTQHVDHGLSVLKLCEATVTVSDNTADNLLFEILGGPPAAAAFARTLGDQVTRFDRIEPDLSQGAPGDERDTSTPAQLAADLRALVLGDALDPAGRELLTGWLLANTTGGRHVRAGLPAGWRVGDKTGSGFDGEINDIAVVWPPNRAPLVITVFTAPTDPKATTGYATIASATAIAVKALVPAP